MIIKFKKTNPDAVLPKRNHDNRDGTGDTGYDVYSVEDKVIPARGSAVVDVGLEFAYIEPHYWVKIEGRSGLGFKHDIIPHGGIVDNAFRGKFSDKNEEFLCAGIIDKYDEEWSEEGDSIYYICNFRAFTGLNGNVVEIDYEWPGNSCFHIRELDFTQPTEYAEFTEIRNEYYYTNDDFTENIQEARLAQFKKLSLDSNIYRGMDEVLTREDCINLFYNLMKALLKTK